MILIINTNGLKNTIVISKNKKTKYEKSWQVVKSSRKDILQQINKFLHEKKINLKQIKAIIVYRGPGSFTSVRVGICIANSLGFSLNIPVFGVKGNEFNSNKISVNSIDKIHDKINKIKVLVYSNPVKPFYTTSL